jgi:hypothetical protein
MVELHNLGRICAGLEQACAQLSASACLSFQHQHVPDLEGKRNAYYVFPELGGTRARDVVHFQEA